MKKRVKIFAAFDKGVEEDVAHFGDFLCTLNVQCRDIELSIFKGERELCESLERLKEQVDGELETCEYFLLILGGKSSDYALDKLNRVIGRYAETHGCPDIHIFVNTAHKDAGNIVNFFASEKYEHYVEQFSHVDTLKAKFLIWLSAKEKGFAYEVDKDIHGSPVIKVDGHPVSGLLDFDALLNNEDYQDEKKKLMRKRAEREKCIAELRAAEGDDRHDLWDDISALTKEIEERQDKIAKLEKDTLALYQNYARMTLESGYNSRLKRALECIERGELDRAKRVLDPDGSIGNLKAMENENEVLAARIETNKKIAEQEINILFAEIGRLELDTGNGNRFEEIEKCYANIEHFQEKLGLEMTVLFAYAAFLDRQNKHNAAIEKYMQELTRCRKLAEINSDTYLPAVANALNNLGVLQKDMNRHEEAEVGYIEALDIYQKLAATDPDTYLPNVAMTLGNLGVLQKDMNRHEEAEVGYIEALEICQKLAATDPDTYLPDVAMTLGNLGILQADTNCYAKAEESFVEALEIYRQFAGANPGAYLRDVAGALNNLAALQRRINHYVEAEAGYVEALEIRRKLAESNPDVYLTNVAMPLNNLALLQAGTNRYAEAETSYIEVLEIYRKLAASNPDVYLWGVANTLYNLAALQANTNRCAEAEMSYVEALEIRRELAATNPDAYLPDVAATLNNLANLQKNTNRRAEAEMGYVEALEIYRKLAATSSDACLPNMATTLNNLAALQANTNRCAEAEMSYVEALEIHRKLAAINPDAYLPDVADTLIDLANLQLGRVPTI